MEREFIVAGARHGHVNGAASTLAAEGWRCLGVADDDPTLAEPLAERLGCDYLKDIGSLLSKRPAPLVLTAEINSRKWEVAVEALKAGSHVLADKPLATDIKQLEQIQSEAEQAGKGVWALFTLRYSGLVRALKSLVDAGDLGAVVSVEAVRPHRLNPDSRPDWMFRPEEYGGVLNDLACHDIDAYLWLCGRLPEWVKAEERSTRFKDLGRGEISDIGVALMGGPDAPFGCFRADWLTPDAYPKHGDCRMRVVGTAGTAELFYEGEPSNPAGATLVVFTDKDAPRKIEPEPVKAGMAAELTRYLEEGEPMTLSSEECLRSSGVTLLAAESARSGELVHINPERL